MEVVGRITRLFGVAGEVSLNLYSTFPDDFNFEEQPVFIEVDSMVVPLFFDSFVRRGASGATARFADIDTPLRAQMILGKEFSVRCEEIESDEFFFEDLIGYEVRIGRLRGRIIDFYDNDVNPLFEISLSDRTHLIPAAEEFIATIDFERRYIKFVLPEGLLDL